MKNYLLTTILLITITFFSCAPKPHTIKAQHVSTSLYINYDCDEIANEISHVDRQLDDLHYTLRAEAKTDEWQAIAGMVLVWPALFFLEGKNTPEARKFARLKGEYLALERAARQNNCND